MDQRTLWLLVVFYLAEMAVFDTPSVFAQPQTVYQDRASAQRTATSKFPGFLDTNMVEKRSIVADSMGSIDYGVTENFSVGTNVLPFIFTAAGIPMGYVRLRYRILSHSRWPTVFSLFGGGLRETDTTVRRWRGIGFLTSSTSYYFSARNILTGTLFVGWDWEKQRYPQEQVTFNGQSISLGVAINYEHLVGTRFSLVASIASFPVEWRKNTVSRSTARTERTADLLADPMEATLVRGFAQVRLGNWLLTGGGVVFPLSPEFIPWISAAWSS